MRLEDGLEAEVGRISNEGKRAREGARCITPSGSVHREPGASVFDPSAGTGFSAASIRPNVGYQLQLFLRDQCGRLLGGQLMLNERGNERSGRACCRLIVVDGKGVLFGCSCRQI